jgi:hypothetical protein
MIGISVHSLSLVPGFDREKKKLLRLLSRAAELSEALQLEIDENAFGPQLMQISKQLGEAIYHQRER